MAIFQDTNDAAWTADDCLFNGVVSRQQTVAPAVTATPGNTLRVAQTLTPAVAATPGNTLQVAQTLTPAVAATPKNTLQVAQTLAPALALVRRLVVGPFAINDVVEYPDPVWMIEYLGPGS